MYARYEKQSTSDGYRYRFAEPISLFGCNQGYIPWLFSVTVPDAASEPMPWHLLVADTLRLVELDGSALIINLKPRSKAGNLSLYEVVEVFGFSASGWTPLMLYLRGLFVDENPSRFDEKDFVRSQSETEDPIFSMMYLDGTVRNGKLEGRWTAPRPSSTNSVLLWPASFEYFAQQAQEIIARAG